MPHSLVNGDHSLCLKKIIVHSPQRILGAFHILILEGGRFQGIDTVFIRAFIPCLPSTTFVAYFSYFEKIKAGI
jgi:hypothetical protein